MLFLQLRAGSGTPGTDLMIVSKSYEGNKIMTDLKPNETTGQPPASQENPHKPSDKNILNPSGTYIRNFYSSNEVCEGYVFTGVCLPTGVCMAEGCA